MLHSIIHTYRRYRQFDTYLYNQLTGEISNVNGEVQNSEVYFTVDGIQAQMSAINGACSLASIHSEFGQ